MQRYNGIATQRIGGMDRKMLIKNLEDVIERRDRDNLWGHVKDYSREDCVAALILLKIGIDLDSPTIQKVFYNPNS